MNGECQHADVSRVRAIYVDGRPLYKCDACGALFVYEDAEPSHKALAPLASGEGSGAA